MKFTMTNKSGDIKKLETGSVPYIISILLPIVPAGIIILGVVSIIKKQFKLVMLNYMVIVAITFLLYFFAFLLQLNKIGFLLIILVVIVMNLLFIINMIKNANNYTYNDYLSRGYEIDDAYKENSRIKEFIRKSETTKKSKLRGIFFV